MDHSLHSGGDRFDCCRSRFVSAVFVAVAAVAVAETVVQVVVAAAAAVLVRIVAAMLVD